MYLSVCTQHFLVKQSIFSVAPIYIQSQVKISNSLDFTFYASVFFQAKKTRANICTPAKGIRRGLRMTQ